MDDDRHDDSSEPTDKSESTTASHAVDSFRTSLDRATATAITTEFPDGEEEEDDEWEVGGDEEETTTVTATEDLESKSHRASPTSKGGKKKKKTAAKEPKKKKLNRKAIYKSLKQMSKAIDEIKNVQEKFAWEKEKLFFYWDFATNKYLKVDQQLVNWRRKREAFQLENRHGYFLESWRLMNNSRNTRQEALAARRKQYNSWLTRILDEQREQGYRLTKDICDESRATLITGQQYVTQLVNKRKEFTEDLTKTLEEWRPLMKGTERQLQGHYGKIFSAEMNRQSLEFEKIPADREQRLKDQQIENNRLLREVLSVYENLISHNFVEILHLAKVINQLKTQDRRVREKRDELFKLYTSMTDRMDFLRERVSSLKRQVHAGRKVRTNLLEVLQEQDCLEFRKDVALMRAEWVANEVAITKKRTADLNDQVMTSFFDVKRHLFKNIIRSAGRAKERSLMLKNYAHVVDSSWGPLQDVDSEPYSYKKNEEVENENDGVKVVLGNFKPFTIEDVQERFAGCADSFMTAVVFFQRRLDEQCLTLDDLEFFIRRRYPLRYPELQTSSVAMGVAPPSIGTATFRSGGKKSAQGSRVSGGISVKQPFDTSFSNLNDIHSMTSVMLQRQMLS